MATPEEIDDWFTFHPANNITAGKHETVRDMCLQLADDINNMLPDSREKSVALTKLREVMFWANAAVAINS